MAKIKVLKRAKKSKKIKNIKLKKSYTKSTNKYSDNYLAFYDDIKVSSKKYDW